MYNKRPSIGHLRPFYAKCFVTIPKAQRGSGFKLKPRALEGHLTGYIGKLLVWIYIPSQRRIEASRIGNVWFVPADYIPPTSIEIDSPAITSSSSAVIPQLHSTLVTQPTTPIQPPLSTSPLTFTMPAAFENEDQIKSTVDFTPSSPPVLPTPQKSRIQDTLEDPNEFLASITQDDPINELLSQTDDWWRSYEDPIPSAIHEYDPSDQLLTEMAAAESSSST